MRFRLCPVRSPLLGASRLISCPRGTEMFQFPRCALLAPPMCSAAGDGTPSRRVSPFGHPRIKACVRLPEAFRSLPRPSSAQRHLGIHQYALIPSTAPRGSSRVRSPTSRAERPRRHTLSPAQPEKHANPLLPPLPRAYAPSVRYTCQGANLVETGQEIEPPTSRLKQALCPTSYVPVAGSAEPIRTATHWHRIVRRGFDEDKRVPTDLRAFAARRGRKATAGRVLLRKEVIQPHLPIRLPCYDFTPITSPTFDGCLLAGWLTGFGCCRLSWCDGRCVQGPGTYSPRRSDPRLLAIPASRRRVAACDPNWDRF